jgi:hypothetical protein
MRLRVRDPRLLLVASAALVGAAIAFPLGAIANHQFSDVPNTNTFHADIDAIRDAGVTAGCAAGKYCPKEFVTREQMAAFLNRLGALEAGKTPVVNADKVDGHDDVLDAGDVVVSEVGHWLRYGVYSVTIVHYPGQTEMTATGLNYVILKLHGPARIGDTAYAFKSVRVCHDDAAGTSVIDSNVKETNDSGTFDLVADPTDHSLASPGCFTVTDPTPTIVTGGTTLQLGILFGTAAYFHQVTTTWTPVG